MEAMNMEDDWIIDSRALRNFFKNANAFTSIEPSFLIRTTVFNKG